MVSQWHQQIFLLASYSVVSGLCAMERKAGTLQGRVLLGSGDGMLNQSFLGLVGKKNKWQGPRQIFSVFYSMLCFCFALLRCEGV